MAGMDPATARLNELIANWKAFRAPLPEEERYCQIRRDLYQVRNAGWGPNPPLSVWPSQLLDPSDSMMAAVEHYFLCRCWVGTGVFPAWQMTAMNAVYDAGKMLGVTPNHNPNKPTTPLTALQMSAQAAGVRDGKLDLVKFGKEAPLIGEPPKYW